MKSQKINIIDNIPVTSFIFIILTYLISWLAYLVFEVPYDLLMFLPMIISCGLTIVKRRPLRSLFKIGSIQNLWLGGLISAAAGLILCFIAYVLSLAQFGLSEQAIAFNNGSHVQAWMRFFILGLPYMLLINIIFALGEEIGWRGFLLNQLRKYVKNFWLRSLIIGIVWGVWHFPLLVRENTSIFQIIVFLVNVCLISILYTRLYERQNAIGPSTIAHAVHNMIFNSIIPSITLTTVAYPILWGEEGLLVTSAYLVIILFIFVKYTTKS